MDEEWRQTIGRNRNLDWTSVGPHFAVYSTPCKSRSEPRFYLVFRPPVPTYVADMSLLLFDVANLAYGVHTVRCSSNLVMPFPTPRFLCRVSSCADALLFRAPAILCGRFHRTAIRKDEESSWKRKQWPFNSPFFVPSFTDVVLVVMFDWRDSFGFSTLIGLLCSYPFCFAACALFRSLSRILVASRSPFWKAPTGTFSSTRRGSTR